MNVNEELTQALKEVTEESINSNLNFINPMCVRCWTGKERYDAGSSICSACSAMDHYSREAFQIIDSFTGNRDPLNFDEEYLAKAMHYPDIDIHLLAALKDVGLDITDEYTASRLRDLGDEQYNHIREDIENYMKRADDGEFDRIEISMKLVCKDTNVERSITVPIGKNVPINVALYQATLSITDDIQHDLSASLNK